MWWLMFAIAVMGEQSPINDNWQACSTKYGCFPVARLPHEVLQIFTSNPHFGVEEHRLAGVALEEWTYSRILHLNCSHEDGMLFRVYFEQIDTVASIYFDGQELDGSPVSNSLIPHYFDLPVNNAKPKSALLEVKIQSSLLYARNQSFATRRGRPYPHSVNFNVWAEPTHRNMLRKPAFHFGWDWGPAFPMPSLGKVHIESGRRGLGYLQQDQLRVDQRFDHNTSAVDICITAYIRKWAGKNLNQTVAINFAHFSPVRIAVLKLPQVTACFRLHQPKLWRPMSSASMGKRQPNHLYLVTVEKDFGGGRLERRIGIRNVQFVSETFSVEINQQAVDWRGVNLVPFDVFVTQTPDPKWLIRTLLEMNMNAVRVWGGGGAAFLPTEFYDECDLWGILVWQDLPYACAMFPMFADVFEETVHLVRNKQYHASIVVWGGNNEVEAAFEWFPKEINAHTRQSYQSEYEDLFMDTIRHAAMDWGGAQVYLDSSPSNGLFPENGTKRWGNVNEPTLGDIHFYNYTMDCELGENYPAHALFVSEFGFQSLPAILPRYVSPADDVLETVLQDRQRHEFGFEQMDLQTLRSFGCRFDGSNGTYAARALMSQVVQGKCLAAAIGKAWRTLNQNRGLLVWQLNDVWPGVSWSLLEFDKTWKASAYAVKRAFAPVRIQLDRKGSTITATLQWFHETQQARLLFGYFIIRPFQWKQDHHFNNNKIMVHFKVNTSSTRQQLVWSMDDDNARFGFKLEGGLAFAGKSSIVFPLSCEEWLAPPRHFLQVNMRDLQDFLIEPHQTSCTWRISARDANQAYAHVWLYWNLQHDMVEGGWFDINGFILLQGETKQVQFITLYKEGKCDYGKLEIAAIYYY